MARVAHAGARWFDLGQRCKYCDDEDWATDFSERTLLVRGAGPPCRTRCTPARAARATLGRPAQACRRGPPANGAICLPCKRRAPRRKLGGMQLGAAAAHGPGPRPTTPLGRCAPAAAWAARTWAARRAPRARSTVKTLWRAAATGSAARQGSRGVWPRLFCPRHLCWMPPSRHAQQASPPDAPACVRARRTP